MNYPSLAFFIALTTGTAAAGPLKILTEEYPPYNFKQQDAITGASTEQVEMILKEAEIGYTIELLPWARAYALAQSQPATCVYTTGHSDERDAAFKWVEPLLVDRMIMVRKAGSKAAPETINEAKGFVVGTQRGDFSEEFLKRNKFPMVDVATDLDSTFKKLMAGRIDMMMTSEKTFETMKAEGATVEAALMLDGRIYSLACNPAVADETIARMQAILDRLIADGTQDRIFVRYGLTPNRR